MFLIYQTLDYPSGNPMDPYARARTVRLGKWRWPPPKEEMGEAGAGDQTAEGFFEFKMRKLQQKMGQPSRDNQGRDEDLDTSGEIQSNRCSDMLYL